MINCCSGDGMQVVQLDIIVIFYISLYFQILLDMHSYRLRLSISSYYTYRSSAFWIITYVIVCNYVII